MTKLITKREGNMQREEVDAVVAGGASHVATLASALWTLSGVVDIRRVGGASAGAIAAAGEAFAVPPGEQQALMRVVLKNNYLKDRALNPLERYGIYAGERLHAELKKVFGNRRMKDALIPLRIAVCDLYTAQPVLIDSELKEHGELLVADVLRCSAAIPVFFKAWTLPQWRGNRLFVDGGTAANFALGMFDDVPDRRTIGLRLEPKPPEVNPIRGLGDFAAAIASILLWASDNAYISKKKYADVISVPQVGSGLDFNLTDAIIDARFKAGRDAVLALVA